MRKYILLLVVIGGLVGCKKDGGGGGEPVSEEAVARVLFSKINGLWTGTLKPALTKTKQTYTNYVLSDSAGGQATVNGSYTATSYSGSSGSTASSMVDATIRFEHFTRNGLRLDGTFRFYDGYSYRQDCGSSGCASSTHTSVTYNSKDGSGNVYDPLAVSFSSNGVNYADKILLYASKPYSSFSVKLTNTAGDTFSFSY